MNRRRLWRLAPVIVFSLAVAGPVHAQSFGFPWWRDAQFQKDLSLTTDQSARIDALFQANKGNGTESNDYRDGDRDRGERAPGARAGERGADSRIDQTGVRAGVDRGRHAAACRARPDAPGRGADARGRGETRARSQPG